MHTFPFTAGWLMLCSLSRFCLRSSNICCDIHSSQLQGIKKHYCYKPMIHRVWKDLFNLKENTKGCCVIPLYQHLHWELRVWNGLRTGEEISGCYLSPGSASNSFWGWKWKGRVTQALVSAPLHTEGTYTYRCKGILKALSGKITWHVSYITYDNFIYHE